MLFGTDMPFDMELGNEAIREAIKSVEGMDIPEEEKQAICENNARRLLRLDWKLLDRKGVIVEQYWVNL
jgi:predicted TIM-barrel fold metal-dependent hydrolase